VYSLRENVLQFVRHYGLEHVGFFTITFPRNVTTWQEASKRFNSFRSHVLKGLFVDFILVLEFHRDGRPHYHLLVATAADIRSGFNFELYRQLHADSRLPRPQRMALSVRRRMSRDLSDNLALRTIWKRVRDAAEGYGVGRCETIPIRKTGEAIAVYVGGYIAASLGHRKPEHKGARFVRYSQQFRRSVTSQQFSWASPAGWVWRSKVRMWAIKRGCFSLGNIRSQFGRRWAYRHREEIHNIVLSVYPSFAHARVDGLCLDEYTSTPVYC
jgi:hypothetical protein